MKDTHARHWQGLKPTDKGDNEPQKEPISVSKLDKEDAAWQDLKRCFGWDYAAKSKNLLAAPHRYEKILEVLAETKWQERTGLKSWQSLIGQLWSLVPGVPGSKDQFSILQMALTTQKEGCVKIDATVQLMNKHAQSKIYWVTPKGPLTSKSWYLANPST